MPTLTGVHLLPSTGEFTYDTLSYVGRRASETAFTPLNTYAGQGPTTDYSVSLNQLQALHPECDCVSIVCAWFFDSTAADVCQVFPSTTYIGGAFARGDGGADEWRCSGLNQTSAGLLPIPTAADGTFIYGGTPSDQSLVRCVQDLRARGLRVVFYPFLLSTAAGEPWRGRIGYAPDVSSAATAAVNAFLGGAAASQFARDAAHLTVGYSGSATDWTYRRMILHYANLMVVAGGVDLFVIGSELRGLETVRGPGWTPAGTVDGAGRAFWDYPFVAGLAQLAADVRGVFDGAGLAKDTVELKNLLTYSADWSSWMGWQHPGANGQWPHLDTLWASPNVDFVSLDNYLPLSDWTSAGGLDAANWRAPAPISWPVAAPNARGFGLSGAPTLLSSAYLQANIEGGEKFDWFYANSTNGGAGDDPNGSGLIVSLPEGDRATQTRQAYYAGQQILANKQVRWWWNNPHQAVYAHSGGAWVGQGPTTQWTANAKPVIFLEYGFPACDRATNQPNLFYSAASTETGTPFWSIWRSVSGGGLAPLRDDTIFELALNAVHDYWRANNQTVAGAPLIQWTFCCAWNWDARPFPTFPDLVSVWGDAGDWATGNWIGPGRTALAPAAPAPDPAPGAYPAFPALATPGWSASVRPRYQTQVATHASGRESRFSQRALADRDIELTYDVLRADANAQLQAIAGFYAAVGGRDGAFWLAPPGLGAFVGQALGVGDGAQTNFALVASTGSAVEPVQATSGVTAVYLNGVAQSGWSVTSGFAPALAFASAPAAGAAVTADFGALWLCRFAEDVADFENFLALLWRWRTVKLQTTRP